MQHADDDTPDPGHTDSDGPPRSAHGDALAQLGGLFGKANPLLKRVDEAIEKHGGLPQARDAMLERAGELIEKADDALSRLTAVEGTVVESTVEPTPPPPASRPGDQQASTPPPRAGAAGAPASTPSTPHWNRQRVMRMAAAAGREAIRPAPRRRPARHVAVAAGALGVMALLVLLIRRR